jgi:hypothetical protein
MSATILSTLGINLSLTLHTPLGRPVALVDGGKRVGESCLGEVVLTFAF